MHEEIIEKLAGLIAKEVLREPGRVINADDKIISSGMIDSFNLVDLALCIESALGVRLEDVDLNADRFDTLAELAALIAERKA